MLKRIISFTISVLIIHQTIAVEPQKKLTKQEKIIQKKNEKIAKAYLKRCKSQKKNINLFKGFPSEEILRYWEEVPNLKKQADKADKLRAAAEAVIFNHKRYQEAKIKSQALPENKRRGFLSEAFMEVFEDLHKSKNRTFMKAQKNFKDAGKMKSFMTFKHIIKVYKKEGKIIPVDWIN